MTMVFGCHSVPGFVNRREQNDTICYGAQLVMCQRDALHVGPKQLLASRAQSPLVQLRRYGVS
jgi:hypothetical protein